MWERIFERKNLFSALKRVKEAEGDVARFRALLEQYEKAPDVTRQRMYLETMERILAGSEKTVIDQNGASQQGVVPYLPLGEFQKKAGAPK